MGKKGVCKVLAGVGIGAAIGVLFAPRKGSETRKIMMDKAEDLMKKVKDIDAEEVRNEITEKIEEIKKEISELDKEKVLDIAKEKSQKITNKIAELSRLAKDKATPVIDKAIDELRDSAIKVTEEVLKKLEKSKNKELNA